MLYVQYDDIIMVDLKLYHLETDPAGVKGSSIKMYQTTYNISV